MTAYLASVQDRLHQTELARVTAETRALTERTRRRLTLALAASVVGLVALGGGGWRYLERQRSARQEAIEEAINERIEHAAVVQGKAVAAPIGDLSGWGEALSEIKAAEELLRHAETDSDLTARVASVRSDLERGQGEAVRRAREAEADQRLVAHLETVRTDRGEHWDPERTDREFAEAFRDYGVDLERTDPTKAGVALSGRAASVEIAAALDDWCAIRQYDLAGRPNAPPWKGLAEAARAADPDSWRNMLRALYGRPLSEGLTFLKERAADHKTLEKLPAASLLLLAHMLQRAGGEKQSADVLRTAWRRFPGDFWVNHTLGSLSWTEAGGGGYRRPEEAARYLMAVVVIRPQSASGHTNLGAALHDKGDLDGAIAEQREAIQLQPDNAGAHTNLGEVLRKKGKIDEAIAEHREALRLEPGIAEVHTNLGRALSDKGDQEVAIRELREAIRLKPTLAIAHNILGQVLQKLGDQQGAIVELREALRLQPDLAAAHDNLGKVWLEAGNLDAAISAFRAAVHAKPDNADFHIDLSNALRQKGDLDDAIEAIREALRLHHNDASAHTALALALTAKGYLHGAVIEFREALREHPEDPSAHLNLGKVLGSQGDYAEAVEQYRQGLKLAGPRAEERFPGLSRQLIELEHQAALAKRLPAVLRGAERPRDPSDALALAGIARVEEKFAAAARLSAEALAAKPDEPNDVKSSERYKAACLAVLAGCGQGRDNPAPDSAARAKLRNQALEWLRADLHRDASLLEGAEPSIRKEIASQLGDWQKNPDLAGVRDEAGLTQFPREEREVWKKFWSDADALREKALEKLP
jgi:tetratricopeptide (TPR) repeat protein